MPDGFFGSRERLRVRAFLEKDSVDVDTKIALSVRLLYGRRRLDDGDKRERNEKGYITNDIRTSPNMRDNKCQRNNNLFKGVVITRLEITTRTKTPRVISLSLSLPSSRGVESSNRRNAL
jgi:hypothetical protein